MSIIAYDSAAPQFIPASAAAIFPYADGYAWSAHRFPKALSRYITTRGDWEYASIIDVEPGCVWPPNDGRLRDFVEERERSHGDACVYADRSAVAECMAALVGVKPGARLWLSTLDGSQPTSYDGFKLVGVQYLTVTGRYDKSVIYDEAWMRHQVDKNF